jgi:hypothetical protein
LVTAGVPSNAGVLGPASPQTLFQGGDVDSGARSGGRFRLGLWFWDSQVIGLEGGYFFLGDHSVTLAAGQEDSSPPGTPPGVYQVSLSSLLQCAELNAVANVTRSGPFRLDFLGGFRYLQLDETLHAEQDFISADQSELDTWDDEFHTHNHFYGGQIGARAEWVWDRLVVDVSGKVALGVTNQQVALNGGLTRAIATPGMDAFGNPVQNVQVVQGSNSGLLAQPDSYSCNHFTVVPEVNLDVGYQFTRWFRATLGYSFLYWSSVARPGDQVSGVPRMTGFWAQGLNCGLGFSY